MQLTEKHSLNKKATLKDVKNVFFIVIFLIFVGVGIYSSNDAEQPKEVPQPVQQVIPEKILEPVYDLSQADYKIMSEEDLSFALADRFRIKVLVNDNPVTEAEIKAISEKIVLDYKEKADAITIAFYFDESQVESAYTLAMADWAPNGKWGDADLKTNQILVYNFKDIVIKD